LPGGFVEMWRWKIKCSLKEDRFSQEWCTLSKGIFCFSYGLPLTFLLLKYRKILCKSIIHRPSMRKMNFSIQIFCYSLKLHNCPNKVSQFTICLTPQLSIFTYQAILIKHQIPFICYLRHMSILFILWACHKFYKFTEMTNFRINYTIRANFA